MMRLPLSLLSPAGSRGRLSILIPVQVYATEHVALARDCGFAAAVTTAWGCLNAIGSIPIAEVHAMGSHAAALRAASARQCRADGARRRVSPRSTLFSPMETQQ